MLKLNLAANYIGQAFGALLTLIFTPIYLKYLVVESFGLIGIFLLIQAWFSVLDFGLSATVTREIPKIFLNATQLVNFCSLLRASEWILICVSLFTWIAAGLASNFLIENWESTKVLTSSDFIQVLNLMSLIVGLKLFEGIYKGCLVGLQKQILLNWVFIFASILRMFGCFLVLKYISSSVVYYFIWQLISTILTVVLLGFVAYKFIPVNFFAIRASILQIIRIKEYALGIFGLSLLSIILSQFGNLIISANVGLVEYGYYSLSMSAAGVLFLLVAPISQIWLSHLNQKFINKDRKGFVEAFHLGSSLVSILVGSTAITLIYFAEPILYYWIRQKPVVVEITPIVRLLAIGNLMNALLWIPLQAQLVHGWTKLAMVVNIISVIVLLPLLIIAVPSYGVVGAVSVWIALNLLQLSIVPSFVFKRIMRKEMKKWYINDIVSPIAIILFVNTSFYIIYKYINFFSLDFALIIMSYFISMIATFTIIPNIIPETWKIKLDVFNYR